MNTESQQRSLFDAHDAHDVLAALIFAAADNPDVHKYLANADEDTINELLEADPETPDDGDPHPPHPDAVKWRDAWLKEMVDKKVREEWEKMQAQQQASQCNALHSERTSEPDSGNPTTVRNSRVEPRSGSTT